MHVRFMNLSMEKKSQRKPYEKVFEKILKSGMFIMGAEVEQFEAAVCKYTSSKYALGVSSGTDALILALKAYDIGKDDEVIVPDMSFIATANAVSQVGANAVFCDVDDDFNINTKQIKNLISSKCKAIIVVHYGGKMADMQGVMKIAKEHNLRVIEDASQSFGAKYNNKMAGTLGDIGCFSLNPMKPLGALGEAGIITLHSKKIYNKLKALRYNGLSENKECIYRGVNAKIDTLQAAFLSIKLQELDVNLQKRKKVVQFYNKHLSAYVQTPLHDAQKEDAYFSYTILVKNGHRNKLFSHLIAAGIEVKINHTSMHKEPAYKNENHAKLKNSLRLSKEKLALPSHENLKKSELKYIVKTIQKFYDGV